MNITKAFIYWITIQLMIIGYGCIDITNQVKSHTFDCNQLKEHINPNWGALFPIAAFINIEDPVDNYCKGKI